MTFDKKAAQKRNWLKMRLMGALSIFNETAPLTEREKKKLEVAKQHILYVLDKWDSGTEELRGKPLPPFKCYWCSKRSNVQHLVSNFIGEEYINVCAKHLRDYSPEEIKQKETIK